MAIYPVDEILPLCGEDVHARTFEIAGQRYSVSMASHRYICFLQSGTICLCCGLEGTIMALQRFDHEPKSAAHFNLYGPNSHGHMVMLTKDHIKPKSKGGKNVPSNYQTLCQQCNKAKGAKKYTLEKLKEVRRCTEAQKAKNTAKRPRMMGSWSVTSVILV